MDDRDERIRRKAYELWEAAGRPEGRHEHHWVEAREIVALEDVGGDPTVPVRADGEPGAEPALAQESLGDLPGLRDQGDSPAGPEADRLAEGADQRPLAVEDAPKRGGRTRSSRASTGETPKTRRSAATSEGPAQPETPAPRGRKRPSSRNGAGASR